MFSIFIKIIFTLLLALLVMVGAMPALGFVSGFNSELLRWTWSIFGLILSVVGAGFIFFVWRGEFD